MLPQTRDRGSETVVASPIPPSFNPHLPSPAWCSCIDVLGYACNFRVVNLLSLFCGVCLCAFCCLSDQIIIIVLTSYMCFFGSYTYKDVLKFDISVHYLVCMEVDQSHAQLPHGMICICLTEVATV